MLDNLKSFYAQTLRNNVVVDSRGNELKSGDKALICNETKNILFLSEISNCNFSVFSYYMLGSGKILIFKITDDEYSSCVKLCNSFSDDSFSFEPEKGDSMTLSLESREKLYKQLYNKTTTRSMDMLEITGKQLQIGDLVVFFRENNESDYGIVYSNNKVVLSDMTTKIVKTVYKPLILSDKELGLQKEMQTSMIKQRSVNIKKLEKLERGMIFTSKDNLYIYLGKCTAFPYYTGVSGYDVEYKIDTPKELYIKLPATNLNRILQNSDYLFDVYGLGVGNWHCREKRRVIDDYLEVIYYAVDYIDIFTEKTESNLKYWGKMELKDSITVHKNISLKLTYFD